MTALPGQAGHQPTSSNRLAGKREGHSNFITGAISALQYGPFSNCDRRSNRARSRDGYAVQFPKSTGIPRSTIHATCPKDSGSMQAIRSAYRGRYGAVSVSPAPTDTGDTQQPPCLIIPVHERAQLQSPATTRLAQGLLHQMCRTRRFIRSEETSHGTEFGHAHYHPGVFCLDRPLGHRPSASCLTGAVPIHRRGRGTIHCTRVPARVGAVHGLHQTATNFARFQGNTPCPPPAHPASFPRQYPPGTLVDWPRWASR